jgi:phenylalanyl-tRNA synthetase beta chain
MRVPLSWLHDYCQPHLDAHTLATRLAMTGTEVERVEHHGVNALEHFVVGHVLERRKHPDADRLSVCMVDVGGSTPSQIVCGAPNVAAGQTVGVARPGSVMPDGKTLQKAKLRGQSSDGMILAEDEVGIGTDHNGIMVLTDGIAPGTPLETVLPIATEVLVLEITPNRPDCLGIYGVAREVYAATGAPLKPPPWTVDPGSEGALEGIEIANLAGDELCPRFTARILDGIRIAPSPLWLKARLMAAGQRPISNVVDITNYVMLLTGQPMHAFDLGRVAGATLTVRRARAGERVETLDGQTRTLDDQMLVIDDAEGPTSIAGVMGGARSEVSETTASVVSEAATWSGANIHRTSLELALRSEASSRFEKGLQPEQAIWAQAVATKLYIDLCGATVRPGTVDLGGPGPAPRTVILRDGRVRSLLGVTIERDRCAQILAALGFTARNAPANDGLEVEVPDFRRTDVTREADLIEEVARIDGLENLPSTLPSRRSAVGRLTPRQRQRRRASDALAALGLHEVVGWSFSRPDIATRLRLDGGAGHAAVALANPMSSEQSELRTTLLGSLLEIARRNRAHGAGALRLFEAGAVYLPSSVDPLALPDEPQHLAALIAGPVRTPTWRDQSPRAADFFAAKGAVGAVLDSLGLAWDVRSATRPFLHPGRSADLLLREAGHADPAAVAPVAVGWVGELHPAVAAEWGFEDTVAAFELDLDALPEPRTATYRDLTSFPEVREDIAVLVSDTVTAAQVLAVLGTAGAPLLARAEVFDVYRDADKLGAGNVSLALRLVYRADDRTLTDTEVARHRQKIAGALEQELGGRIRDSQ